MSPLRVETSTPLPDHAEESFGIVISQSMAYSPGTVCFWEIILQTGLYSNNVIRKERLASHIQVIITVPKVEMIQTVNRTSQHFQLAHNQHFASFQIEDAVTSHLELEY